MNTACQNSSVINYLLMGNYFGAIKTQFLQCNKIWDKFLSLCLWSLKYCLTFWSFPVVISLNKDVDNGRHGKLTQVINSSFVIRPGTTSCLWPWGCLYCLFLSIFGLQAMRLWISRTSRKMKRWKFAVWYQTKDYRFSWLHTIKCCSFKVLWS